MEQQFSLKPLLLISLLLLTFNLFAYSQQLNQPAYVCYPCGGHCDTLQFDSPGKCTHCSMELIEKSTLEHMSNNEKAKIKRYVEIIPKY